MFSTTRIFLILGIFSLVLLPCCSGQGNCTNTRDFTVPAVNAADGEGWEVYSNPLVLNKENVKGLSPGTGSPEAAVVHFYASKIRGDDCFNQVLPADRKKYPRVDRSLKRMADWKFIEVKLVSRKKKYTERYWIRVEMKIEIKGKVDTDMDEARVRIINGQWYVTEPPT